MLRLLHNVYFGMKAMDQTAREAFGMPMLRKATDMVVNYVELCNNEGLSKSDYLEQVEKMSEWDDLPDSKSLFCQPPGRGIVIGNLSSQLIFKPQFLVCEGAAGRSVPGRLPLSYYKVYALVCQEGLSV